MPDRHPLDVGELSATLSNVTLPVGLTLDQVVLRGHGIHLAQNPFEFKSKQAGSLVVEVSEASIGAFLNKRAPAALSDISVEISGGTLTVNALAKVLIPIRVSAICTLQIEDGKRLVVQLESVGVLGDAVKRMVQAQLDQVNPVFDVDEFPIDATLASAQLDGGMAKLEGALVGLK